MEGPKPLYLCVVDGIKAKIKNNKLPIGAPIGTQSSLTKEFGISLVTLRHAIELLQKQGLIETRQGKGIYVSSNAISQDLRSLLSMNEIIEAQGLHHEIKIVEFGWIMPSRDIMSFFKTSSENPVLKIRRLHIVEGLPIAMASIFVPAEIGVGIKKSDLESVSLYSIMENKLGMHPGKAFQKISAIASDKTLSCLLEIPEGFPVLVAETQTYSDSGIPIEHITFFYRSDYYKFSITLQRASASPMVSPCFPQNAGPFNLSDDSANLIASMQISKVPVKPNKNKEGV